MGTKRMLVCMPPVEAVNGKIAGSDEKVNKYNQGFKCFIGYQNSWSTVNRFMLRKKALPEPNQNQKEAQEKFKQAFEAMQTIYKDPTKLADEKEKFLKQSKYKTLRGFIFAEEYAKL